MVCNGLASNSKRVSFSLASASYAVHPVHWICNAFTPKTVVCICVDFEIVHVAFFFALIIVLSTSRSFCVQLQRQMKHSRASMRRGGGAGWSRVCLWKETLYPPATLAPHSTSCLPASLHIQSCPVMPAVNGHTLTLSSQ